MTTLRTQADPVLGVAERDPAIILPFRLHADAVEELLEALPPVVEPPRFDARHVRAVEPGALLSLTLLARLHGVQPPTLPLPADPLIPPLPLCNALTAATLFEAVSSPRFTDRLGSWGWTRADARKLAGVVGELARNAIEHAGAPAWVAAWRTSPGELRVAVADAGVGFAGSLGLRDEREAVLQALVHGPARVRDEGRGDGLRRVAKLVAGWGGVMRVRSRTVLLAGTLPWSDAAVRTQLPLLPGVQVEISVPCLQPARNGNPHPASDPSATPA